MISAYEKMISAYEKMISAYEKTVSAYEKTVSASFKMVSVFDKIVLQAFRWPAGGRQGGYSLLRWPRCFARLSWRQRRRTGRACS